MAKMIEVECAYCGKKCLKSRRDYDRSKTKVFYCSKECLLATKQIHTICDNCGKEITIASWQAKRNKHNFCSKECADSYRRGKSNTALKQGQEIECAYCGTKVWRNYSSLKKASHGVHFCSPECKNAYRAAHPLERAPRITTKCKWCGKEYAHVERRNPQFCSQDCYFAWKHSQKQAPAVSVCPQCGKSFEYKVGAYRRFCSKECQNAWLRSEAGGEEVRLRCANWVAEIQEGRRMTRPQVRVNEMLEELGIEYLSEDMHKCYSVDVYLPETNLIIEVQGDYWHCHPVHYPIVDDRGLKKVWGDRRRHTYFKKHEGIEILYLWESDINQRPEMCMLLILEYVNRKGILPEYQSFNYEVIDGELYLKKERIVPYIEYKTEALRALKTA